MCAEVAPAWTVGGLPEVCWLVWVAGLIGLLRGMPGLAEVLVQKTGHELVRDQGAYRAAADPEGAPPRVVRGEQDRLRGHLGLVNRRDGLRLVGQAGKHPIK